MKTRGNAFEKSPLVAAVVTGSLSIKATLRAKKEGAGLIEIRLDTFKNLDIDALKKDIRAAKKAAGLPILLTIRSIKEGGARRISDSLRMELFSSLIGCVDMVDVELSSGSLCRKVCVLAARRGRKRIVSFHDFKKTPPLSRLRKVIKKARLAGADVVKIAALASGVKDLTALASLLAEGEDLVVIAMGKAGRPSRVLFPLMGSLVTYGSIGRETAPGQLTVKQLKKAIDSFA